MLAAAASALHSTSMCLPSPKPPPALDQSTTSTTTTGGGSRIFLTTPSKPKTLLQDHPLYQTAHPNLSFQFKEKILCLEILGVDSGRVLSRNPSLRSASLDSLHAVIDFLQSKGLHLKDLGRIFGMCPTALTADVGSDLSPVFDFLARDLGVPDRNFRRSVNKCPRLLVSSVRDQLRPALFYLRRLGFRDAHALAYQDPILLVSSVENTLIPKLDYLVGLGLTRKDAVEMVLRCPGLFTFSIENNFRPKMEYFREVMGGELQELQEFPQYFTFSLENRIKPRHKEVVESGARVPLPAMLKSTDEEFRELLKRANSI
ncbi:Mitochondrial transcription termination factor family protein [Striga hermonthica]|uniref:Mitochondrial transcription termination factor family protein n=1 Tax=Striga hermonthica TaxID=68872 RepID=A0A9N7RIM5_STRHE|nr:Mitochondrial transcription termination factor family protein [Striga hermonthica]